MYTIHTSTKIYINIHALNQSNESFFFNWFVWKCQLAQADSLIRAKRRALFRVRNALRQAGVRDVNRSLVASKCLHHNKQPFLHISALILGFTTRLLISNIRSNALFCLRGVLPRDLFPCPVQTRGFWKSKWFSNIQKKPNSPATTADLPLRTLRGWGAGRDGSWRRWKGQELQAWVWTNNGEGLKKVFQSVWICLGHCKSSWRHALPLQTLFPGKIPCLYPTPKKACRNHMVTQQELSPWQRLWHKAACFVHDGVGTLWQIQSWQSDALCAVLFG